MLIFLINIKYNIQIIYKVMRCFDKLLKQFTMYADKPISLAFYSSMIYPAMETALQGTNVTSSGKTLLIEGQKVQALIRLKSSGVHINLFYYFSYSLATYQLFNFEEWVLSDSSEIGKKSNVY